MPIACRVSMLERPLDIVLLALLTLLSRFELCFSFYLQRRCRGLTRRRRLVVTLKGSY